MRVQKRLVSEVCPQGEHQRCGIVRGGCRIEAGLIDADLGGGLMKQRVARPGAGRSGGYRMVLAFRTATRAVFIFGFAKSAQANINDDDERALKALAKQVLGFVDAELDRLIVAGKFEEVMCDGEDAARNLPE